MPDKQANTRAVIGTDHEAAAIKAAARAMPGLTREHAIQVAAEALELAAPHIRAAERERCAEICDMIGARYLNGGDWDTSLRVSDYLREGTP